MRTVIAVLLLVWGAPALAMSLALAKVERAGEGESEQQVCDRALQMMTEELHASLLSVIAATDDYQTRMQAYKEQDRSESLLRDAYLSQLQEEKPTLQGVAGAVRVARCGPAMRRILMPWPDECRFPRSRRQTVRSTRTSRHRVSTRRPGSCSVVAVTDPPWRRHSARCRCCECRSVSTTCPVAPGRAA